MISDMYVVCVARIFVLGLVAGCYEERIPTVNVCVVMAVMAVAVVQWPTGTEKYHNNNSDHQLSLAVCHNAIVFMDCLSPLFSVINIDIT